MTDKKDPLAKFFKKTRRLLNNLSDPNDPSIKYENFKNDASNWVNTAKLIKEIRDLEKPIETKYGEKVAQMLRIQDFSSDRPMKGRPINIVDVEELAEKLYHYVAYPDKPIDQRWLPDSYFKHTFNDASSEESIVEIFSFLDEYLEGISPWMYRQGFDDYLKSLE